jgi:hypothetical protein
VDQREVAGSIRELAGRVRKRFPGHIAADHISDAASALGMGLHDGAIRHLHAAIQTFTPLELHRAGIENTAPGQAHSNAAEADRNHAAAKRFMDDAHRHALLVRDLKGDAPRDGSGQFAGGVRQYANAGAGGTIELANRALAQMQL